MTALTADQIAQKWANNLGAATSSIQAGVNAVTVAPGQAAARQKTVWQQNVVNAADKWASRVAAVPLQTWQQDMLTKGVPRIATGATAAQPKFSTFMGKLLPYINSAKAQLPARGNLQQNIARMTQFVTAMSQFSNSGS